MKVALHIVEERRQELAVYLQSHAYAPLREVCARFDISTATARRDLAVLAARKQIVRTYGGALTEYNQRFPSFRERVEQQGPAKQRIAVAACSLIEPGSTCFLDFGTTVYALAQELKRRPVRNLRVVTNSLPVAELLAEVKEVRVSLLGGEILPRQSALLGKPAQKAVAFYPIRHAFMSAEAANPDGVWNSQGEVVELQSIVMKRAEQTVLCLDASKFKRKAPAFLGSWQEFDLLITNRNAATKSFATCEQTLV